MVRREGNDGRTVALTYDGLSINDERLSSVCTTAKRSKNSHTCVSASIKLCLVQQRCTGTETARYDRNLCHCRDHHHYEYVTRRNETRAALRVLPPTKLLAVVGLSTKIVSQPGSWTDFQAVRKLCTLAVHCHGDEACQPHASADALTL